jgi:hypothetical protein
VAVAGDHCFQHGGPKESVPTVDTFEDYLKLRADIEMLRYAVGRTMFCPYSGRIMDYRSAVLITARADGSTMAVDGRWFDTVADRLTDDLFEIVDGRRFAARQRAARA